MRDFFLRFCFEAEQILDPYAFFVFQGIFFLIFWFLLDSFGFFGSQGFIFGLFGFFGFSGFIGILWDCFQTIMDFCDSFWIFMDFQKGKQDFFK